MKKLMGLTLILLTGAMGTAWAKGPVSGPGHVIVGADASVWDSSILPDPGAGILPIGGSGQVNGEFVIAERYGIQIGLRAQDRFFGPLMATPSANGKVGIYESETGFSSGTRAKWNYDWHVDLRNAHGVAAGTTLGDYELTLETDFATTIFDLPVPIDLTFGNIVAPANTVLYQQSFNPDFGNDDDEFDATVASTYNLTLVLTPVTFNGPPLAVTIQVNVSDP